jgi:signal transduction histidine kinase/CheY-like chemotaxis protein
MSDNVFEKRYFREKQARQTAEQLLEEKSREIYERNKELESLKIHLEDLVELRTKEAVKATEKANQANLAKSQFLANMSHEIRTPLTAIIGYAELLLRDKPDPEKTDSHLGTIIDNGRHLTDLLSEILDLSKIETHNLIIEHYRFNLPHLIVQLKELHQVHANFKNLSLTFEIIGGIPQWIVSDPTRIKQVLHNLLSNAIKFTCSGEISFRVKTEWEDNRIIFTVKDSGEGISLEHQESIFDSFKQADASITRKYGGTGLGLSIAKDITELMGGKLTVSSALNIGSEFTASIVAHQLEGSCSDLTLANSPENNTNQAHIPNLSGAILLVEDTYTNQQLIRSQLEVTGAQVTLAENGLQAIEMALSAEFDLILMDIQMPILDGKEALKGLLQLGYNKPVYALTANVMRSDTAEYMQLGFEGTLTKPLNLSKLYKVLKTHLNHSSASKQMQSTLKSSLNTKINELKPVFISTLVIQYQQMKLLIEINNFADLVKILHVIKGSAGNFGYDSLTDLANIALTSIRSKQFDDVAVLIDNVMVLIEQILKSEERSATKY